MPDAPGSSARLTLLPASWPRLRLFLPTLVLLAACVLAYLPVILHARYIWDDDAYVTKNLTLRSPAGLAQIWLHPHSTPQYYPLVHTTFWLEYHLWALHPFGYHLVNVLLHTASAILVWCVLLRLKFPGATAFFAAALFALHPVHVESVAWITERKNVLSTLFYLLAALAYLRFEPFDADSGPPPRNWRWYPALCVLFVAALLSKTVTATFPAAALLILWWQRGRIRWRNVLPLLPLFVLALAAGLTTSYLEKTHVGAEAISHELNLSPPHRFLLAGRALWFYAGKLLWPAHLSFIYPRWRLDYAQLWQWCLPIAALAVLAALWLLRRRIGRGPLTAALFFAGTLSPALGFVDVYPFRFSYVADHFQYLASLGLITLFAFGFVRWVRPPQLAAVLAVLILAVLGLRTWQQGHVYQNQQTLWTDVLRHNPESWMAHNNLAWVYIQRKDYSAALAHLDASRALKPDNTTMLNNIGLILQLQKRPADALAHLRAVESSGLADARTHALMSSVLLDLDQLDDAAMQAEKAVALEPEAFTERALGVVRLRQGRPADALRLLQRSAARDPDDPVTWGYLGRAQLAAGKPDAAIGAFQLALSSGLRDARASYELGRLLLGRGQTAEAERHLRTALALQPDLAEAHLQLGLVLMNRGGEREALEHFERAVALAPENAAFRFTLADAYATVGDVPRAIATAQEALGLAQAQHVDRLAAIIRQRLAQLTAATQPATASPP